MWLVNRMKNAYKLCERLISYDHHYLTIVKLTIVKKSYAPLYFLVHLEQCSNHDILDGLSCVWSTSNHDAALPYPFCNTQYTAVSVYTPYLGPIWLHVPIIFWPSIVSPICGDFFSSIICCMYTHSIYEVYISMVDRLSLYRSWVYFRVRINLYRWISCTLMYIVVHMYGSGIWCTKVCICI
jgi:hypothetical protein